ncbi:MAG: endopeptidase La [Nitrospirae bacterium GWC2_57_13]|nr:MAG: endopeptidase La [Nitrospirae bacterium GWC2_57_13]OGW45120.1 MAG: endopeptidase La [Nitrospirae bacterium GWD2_57_8]
MEETEQAMNEKIPPVPGELPLLTLKDTVVYPLTVYPLVIGKERSIKLINEVTVGDKILGLTSQKRPDVEANSLEDVYLVGTMARILQMMKVPDGTLRVLVQGLERISIAEFKQTDPYIRARVEAFPDKTDKTVELEALMRGLSEVFQKMVSLTPNMPEELSAAVINIEDPRQLAYLVATNMRLELPQRQEILEIDKVDEKLKKLMGYLNREVEVLELGRKIQGQARDQMQKAEREYLLRQQLSAIRKELGEETDEGSEIKILREKIEQAKMTPEAEKESKRELSRMEKLNAASPEHSVIRTYLEWMTNLPWNKTTATAIDIEKARTTLDADHYDLDKIKGRILEYLSVKKLGDERGGQEGSKVREPILCFAGPPGVGKTSLGQSIARALDRKFVRLSLGGLHDEAEIRGHRRTYIGAMPGRIIQVLKRAEARDPVIMLDEVDKVGADWRGDPSSALLEVLDPEQNKDFRDNYLDVPFDLSKVMFITTANQLGTIPPPLLDRMEVIQLPGYTEFEKLNIAKKYLVPKETQANALKDNELVLQDDAITGIIKDYTREAGVRNLEREIANVCRKVAKAVAESKPVPITVTAENLHDYLGKPKFFAEVAGMIDRPGVVTGLAWTPSGGDILFVEATTMPGNKQLILTGQLGDVMKESAQAALSYVRSKAEELGISKDFYEKSDIHIHVPAGAIPKDGPSAGVTMTTALVSLLTGKVAKYDMAMTGEVTLRGKVMPIGGVKEKVLAARRAGIKTVILPDKNKNDLEDVPEELRKEMTFVFAETIDQVIKAALDDSKKAE